VGYMVDLAMDLEMMMGAEFFNLQRATKECTVLGCCPVVFVVEARFWIHVGKKIKGNRPMKVHLKCPL